LAWCAGILLALGAGIAHAQRVRFEGPNTSSGSALASSGDSSLPDGTAWVARGSSSLSNASSATPSFGSPVAYTTYTSAEPIYTASTAPLTAAPPISPIYVASTAGVVPTAALPSPSAAYGASIGPPPLLASSSTSPWDPYRLAQRPAAFSGTITSPSGQYLLPQPMPRVPYYTQQPVTPTAQPYVVIPETPGAVPMAQPGAVVYPGPTPPAMVSPPTVPILGPAVAPAPVFPTACYAQVDAIFFTRNVAAGNTPLVLRDIVNVTDPNVVFSTADLSIPFQVGPRITLGHEFDATYSFEASYFGIFNWHETLTATGANNLNLPGDLALAGGLAFIGADQVSITYDSQVNNGELNLLHNYGNIACLIGFRYFNLGEHLNIDANDIVDGTGFYDVNAYNNLFGLQGGARIVQACGNWSYDLTGKAGVYGNSISSSQSVEDAGTALRNVHTTGAAVAFLGELGLNGNYQFSQNWFIRGGYQVFWVDGVALAPEQLDFTNTPTSGTHLDKTGSMFMQGAHAGLMARW
jgi:hypothetical protein